MIRRVLVVIDGFTSAQRVLPWVRRLLAPTGGEVRLLALLPPSGPQVAIGTRTVAYTHQREDTERRTREFMLAVLASRLRDDGLQVSVEVRFGDADAVVAAAREWTAHTIAVVDVPAAGLARWIKADLVEQLVRKCALPVLVARAGQRAG